MTVAYTLVFCLCMMMIVNASSRALRVSTQNQMDYIGYQPHSVNDFRAWPQLLKHKPQYFKIDPHYQPNDFCKKLNSTYYPPAITSDPRGCFLFVHDEPVADNNNYGTTIDFWKMVEQNVDYFRQDSFRVYIAMCFKEGGGCDNNWSSLADDFFKDAAMYIEKYALNLEIILDGTAKPDKCSASRWLPWNSVWINNPVLALFSNDGLMGRFQILNAPFGARNEIMRLLKRISYGKFLRNGEYPFLLWEPSEQHNILRGIAQYLDGPINPVGLKFAINIDPVMFDIYSRNTWNIGLLPKSTKPHIVTIPNSDDSGLTILVFYNNNMYGVWKSNSFNGEIVPQSIANNITLPSEVYSVSSYDQQILISTAVDHRLYYFDSSSSLLKFSLVRQTNSTSSIVILYSELNYMVYLAASPSEFCDIQVEASIVKFGNIISIGQWCLVPSKYIPHISSFSIAAVTAGPKVYGTLGFSGNFQTYACTFEANWNQQELLITEFMGSCSNSPVAVGNATKIQMVSSQNDIYFLQVQANSYCDNSEDHNKNPHVSLCDTVPQTTPYILSYTMGYWQDLKEHLTSSKSYITNCHPTMIHGMYDMGQRPSISLFQSVDNTVAALEIHEGLFDKDQVKDVGKCGIAMSHESPTVVLNTWSLSSRFARSELVLRGTGK